MTLSSKIALLDKIKSQPLNTSYRRLAEITGVPKSTISRVLRQESQLREELVLQEGQAGTFKRKREGKDPDCSILSVNCININGSILKEKSEELAKKRGRNDFNATDNGSLCYKHISLFGYNKAMDRITVLCCTNMSGIDKRKLLIIGKSDRPRCFKGLRKEGLSVEYHANKNA
ncbi:hypothetical protein RF11_13885 [Thelohanellus kitauei]|uniref:DDE-1 domain-containing protein n=1 Tax=Thelohanellus kitauei TaxID=669202 RepID=A0A0C2I6U0_THEKT|nr:hypothetical protein RF11_13885 [Thelohanellus kitauei]